MTKEKRAKYLFWFNISIIVGLIFGFYEQFHGNKWALDHNMTFLYIALSAWGFNIAIMTICFGEFIKKAIEDEKKWKEINKK